VRVSDKGVYEIADHEGVVPYPYLDSVNVWSEGIGHTANAGPPDPAKRPKGVEIPLREVLEIFRRDLRKFENRVNSAVKVPLKQHEFDALVSFDFNTGGVHRAVLTKELNAGNTAAAATGFMNWVKPASLRKRRLKEQALFRDGTYSNNGFIPVYRADANGKVDLRSVKLIDVRKALGSQTKLEDTLVATYGVGTAGIAAWLAANGQWLALGAVVVIAATVGFMIWRKR
jgi:lysozyme